MESSTSNVGFVVIGRNEGPRLESCLRAALAVSNKVVYADSASTDGSRSLAERLGVAVVELAADGPLSAARGRNAGYRELRRRYSDCDLVQFLDGDCIIATEWIPAAVQFLRDHPDVAAVCGRRFEAHPTASLYNSLCDDEWNTPVGEAEACGGDALIRCAAMDQVGGYCAELQAGEEPEMTARMRAARWRIWRLDAPMTEHDANILSFRQWWRRTQRGGFGFAQVWSRTAGLPSRLYGRQLASALLWVVALPVAVLLLAAAARRPALLLLVPVAYGLQLARIALRSRPGPRRWSKAALLLVAKLPETIGAARFLFSGLNRRLPEYKG
jgi:glycosyltransferase involved in cell wall biosynthesis